MVTGIIGINYEHNTTDEVDPGRVTGSNTVDRFLRERTRKRRTHPMRFPV